MQEYREPPVAPESTAPALPPPESRQRIRSLLHSFNVPFNLLEKYVIVALELNERDVDRTTRYLDKLVTHGWKTRIGMFLGEKRTLRDAGIDKVMRVQTVIERAWSIQRHIAVRLIADHSWIACFDRAEEIIDRVNALLGPVPGFARIKRAILDRGLILRDHDASFLKDMHMFAVRSRMDVLDLRLQTFKEEYGLTGNRTIRRPAEEELIPHERALYDVGWTRTDAQQHLASFPFLKDIGLTEFRMSAHALKTELDAGGASFTERLRKNIQRLMERMDANHRIGVHAADLRPAQHARHHPASRPRREEHFMTAIHGIQGSDIEHAVRALTDRFGSTDASARVLLRHAPELLIAHAQPLQLALRFVMKFGQDAPSALRMLNDPDERSVLFEDLETFRHDQRIHGMNALIAMLASSKRFTFHTDMLSFKHGWQRLYLPFQELLTRIAWVNQVGSRIPYSSAPDMVDAIFAPTRGECIREIAQFALAEEAA